jgi:hypothetical protein
MNELELPGSNPTPAPPLAPKVEAKKFILE